MFNPEIEKNILDFIKKSPIGVTSSEIAKYLNINRMTMAKYLAVIRERALIDFKQFGMAKMWFIPVEINREWFLSSMLSELLLNLKDGPAINKAAEKIGEEVSKLYTGFYDSEKLNPDQIKGSLEDMGQKIGANFEIAEHKQDKTVIKVNAFVFGGSDKLKKDFLIVLTHLIGAFVSKNTGYAKAGFDEPAVQGAGSCMLTIYMKKTKENEKEKGVEFGTNTK